MLQGCLNIYILIFQFSACNYKFIIEEFIDSKHMLEHKCHDYIMLHFFKENSRLINLKFYKYCFFSDFGPIQANSK